MENNANSETLELSVFGTSRYAGGQSPVLPEVVLLDLNFPTTG